jgi:MFS superfamily sulfate permease-like transporter
LLFWPSLLQDLPQPALAAVVIAAALSLFNIAVLRTYSRMRRSALVISLIASSGVILFGVLEGILIAIALSILLFFRRNWWPEGEVLGRVGELEGWHRTDLFPDAQEIDRILVYRWEAPLFFANAGIFRQEIRKLVRRRKPRWLVVQCEAITDIDVTAADMLDKLDKELNDGGVNVVFVEMRSRIRDLLERYGLFATFTREHVYPSIDMAMRGIEEEERRAPVADAAGSTGAPTDPPET